MSFRVSSDLVVYGTQLFKVDSQPCRLQQVAELSTLRIDIRILLE
jgi:hypothetical protein